MAVAGGGIINSGIQISLKALIRSAIVPLGAIPHPGLALVGVVIVTGIVYAAVKYIDSNSESNGNDRITSPIARRNTYNTKKQAKEAAKRAGGGKEPRHDPNGHDDDRRPHFHPSVSDKYRKTPHGASSHDHYYYSK